MKKTIAFITGVAIVLGGYMWWSHSNPGVGAISFPTSLDTLTNPTATTRTNVVSHADQHSDANDAIEALQAKVGIDGSAVNTSFDFKLSGVADGDYAVSRTGAETLTNKTLTAPNITSLNATTSTFWVSSIFNGTSTFTLGSEPFTISGSNVNLDLGSDATGDIYYRNSSGLLTRLGVGSNGQVLKLASGVPSWASDNTGASLIAKAYATTTQSITTSYTKMRFGATVFDTGSDFQNASSTYLVPEDGYYELDVRLNTNSPYGVSVQLYVNGSATSTFLGGQEGATQAASGMISDVLYLYANDYIEVYSKVQSGTYTKQTANTHFIVKKL